MSIPYEWEPHLRTQLLNEGPGRSFEKKYGIHNLIDHIDNDNYAIMLFQS